MDSDATAVPGAAPPDAAKISAPAPDVGPLPAADEELAPAAWTVRWLGALAGALFGLLLLLAADPRLHPVYHSFDGVVGPPAFSDRSPMIEVRLYGAGLLLCGVCGWVGGMLARRAARRSTRQNLTLTGAAFLAAIALEGFLYGVARRAGAIPPSHATGLLHQLFANPLALLEAFAIGAAAIGLTYPGSIASVHPPSIDLRERRRGWRNPVEVAQWARRFFPPLVFFTVFLVAAWPWPLAGAVSAIPLALIAERLLRPAPIPRKNKHALQALEEIAWIVAALAPAGLYLMRLGRTLHWPLPSDSTVALLAVIVALLPLVAGWRRRAAGWAPAFGPELLLIPALLWCMILAGATLTEYDAFHQGEFIYPIQALRRGLLPWKDIFYIHGFGDDTLGGLFMGRPDPQTHSLDLIYLALTEGASICMALWLYFELWGWTWWPAAFIAAGLGASVGGWTCGRYLLVWISLLLAFRFLTTRRLRWLALAGVAGWLGVLYSLDIGALLGLGVGFWALVWGFAFCGPRDAFQSPLLRHWPALAFSIGAFALMIPTALVLWRLGILADTLVLHQHYAQVKPHYDKFPFEMDFLLAVIGPAASILGIWASLGIIRRREDGPLPGMVLLLTILNLLTWLRALDRSDVGHIAYGSMMTWPLLGSLAVWQARRGHLSPRPTRRAREAAELRDAPANGLRALLVAAFLIALPYASAPIAPSTEGMIGGSIVFPISQVIHFFLADARKPLLGPVEPPENRAFFEEARQLGEIAGAPGPWSKKIVRTFYDFSNQPAFYAWTGLTAPDRFFATHYPSSETWQREVIADLKKEKIQWIMWRGPDAYWNRPDATSDNPAGMPNWLHEWKIAQYILRNYRPAKRLAAEGPTLAVAGDEQPGYGAYDGLLLERTADSPITTQTQSLAPLWLEPIDFGEVPTVWGRGGEGAPAIPPKILMTSELLITSGTATLAVQNPIALAGAEELNLTFDPPADTRCTIKWENAAGETRYRTIQFAIHEKLAGPYRLPVGSAPSWTWAGAPVKLTLSLQSAAPIEDPVKIKLEARSAP